MLVGPTDLRNVGYERAVLRRLLYTAMENASLCIFLTRSSANATGYAATYDILTLEILMLREFRVQNVA